MDLESTRGQVRGIALEILELDAAELPADADFYEVGGDSLALLELITKVEKEFGVRFDDEVANSLRSVEDIVRELHAAA
ncbi:acyl carrier protein [Amycolatopsis sp. cg5]|uniref:acyl carrier protein n=1 Tax=Amycolatopsis sp. cg5 TaxID=3238802 RepID=UPI0035262E26